MLALFVLGAHTVGGCGDDDRPATLPDATPPLDAAPVAATIAITTGLAPELVMFRDGSRASWQPATATSPTTFEAIVHGPYTVLTVCNLVGAPLIEQTARTPEDPHTIAACNSSATSNVVTGHMVQPGEVALADALATSEDPEWDFFLDAPTGTFDLIAASADRIAIRRAIAVNETEVTVPSIDLAQDGTDLVAVAMTAANAQPSEQITSRVFVGTPSTPIGAQVFAGPPSDTRVAPDSALIASDVQTASVRGLDGDRFRSLRRSFRVGGNTVFALPPPIEGLSFAIDGGVLTARWTSLPPHDEVMLLAANLGAGPFVDHRHTLSERYVAAVNPTTLAIDTDIPGFRPEWKIDYAQAYHRGLFTSRDRDGELTTASSQASQNLP